MADERGNPNAIAIVLLAGGAAQRLPGKLERAFEGEPLIVRCYRNLRAAGWPVYIAGKGSFSRDIDASLEAPMLTDRQAARGPLSAFLWACSAISAERLFAIAADQPHLGPLVLQRVSAAWSSGDEAVVPKHGGQIEPLAAIYDRRAVLHHGFALRRSSKGAMRELVRRLQTRFVPMESEHFHNVNRASDLPEAAAPCA